MSKMILATNNNGGLGINNTIPWHSTADFKHFKEETTGKIVVMGYNTWKSLPRRPLPGRLNIVLLSRDYTNRDIVDSDPSVLFMSESLIFSIIHHNPDCVIIGGARIYKLALPFIDTIVLSTINDDTDCDTFFNLESHAKENCIKLELSKVKVLDDGTLVEYWNKLEF